MRVLKRAGDLGRDVAMAILVPVVIALGDAILEQDACNALGCHPVAYWQRGKRFEEVR